MTYAAAIKRLSKEADELIARHGESRDVRDFAKYRGRPVDFFREELGFTPYPKQVEIADSFHHHRRVAVRGAHGVGKDAILAPLMLYAAYVYEMLVLAISATEKQLLGQLWRELGKRFSARLPGELYTADLRIGGEKRIIAMTSGSVSNLTGWHDPNGVFVVISEAQGEQVEAAAFDAAIANAVDDASRILVAGNPVRASGRFFEVSTKATWHAIQISAFDHPNVQEGRVVIPGDPAPGWPVEMEAEFGSGTSWYVSRVLGEFPVDGGIDSLIKAAWLEPAYLRWEAQGGMLASRAAPCIGLDVARSLDRDESVAAVSHGARLHRLVAWRSRDLVQTADRVITVAFEARNEWTLAMLTAAVSQPELNIQNPPACPIYVDAPGIGSGVIDELKRRKQPGVEYWGWKPSSAPERMLNLRSDVFWNLRRLLEDGKAQLPRDPLLREDLLATEWGLDTKGRVQIASKDLMRSALGRSPDRADAAAIALHASAPPAEQHRAEWGVGRWSL